MEEEPVGLEAEVLLLDAAGFFVVVRGFRLGRRLDERLLELLDEVFITSGLPLRAVVMTLTQPERPKS